jgi:molecular chaperone GrpE
VTADPSEFTKPEDADPEQGSPSSSPGSSNEDEAPTDPLLVAQAELAQVKEKLIRMAADFDNFRKRSRREVADAERKGRDGLLIDLLPVFDNLERATSHATSSPSATDAASIKGLVDGITLVMKQFRDALSRLGIERVESVGSPFDPGLHEAIQHLETAEFPPGCIAAEVQPGYRQGERLVRPALVVVAKAPQAAVPVTSDQKSLVSEGQSEEKRSQSDNGESP